MCNYEGIIPADEKDRRALKQFAQDRLRMAIDTREYEKNTLVGVSEKTQGRIEFWSTLIEQCEALKDFPTRGTATVDPMASFPYPDPKPTETK